MAVHRHLSIVGTTASGKSSIALALTQAFPGVFELVSVDSMQVYTGMDVGTAKPTTSEQALAEHHLIDVVDAGADYSLTQFQADAWQAIGTIEARGRRALLVGGTGLYLQSVLDHLQIPGQYPDIRRSLESRDGRDLWNELNALDPLGASRMEPDNHRRVARALEVTIGSGKSFSSFGPGLNAFPANPFRQIGLWLPREVSRERIAERIDAMVDNGWIDEVAGLRQRPWSRTARQALGYPEWEAHLDGSMSFEDAREQVVARTRSFARRQRMWFRRDPRITWFGSAGDVGKLKASVLRDCGAWLEGGDGSDESDR